MEATGDARRRASCCNRRALRPLRPTGALDPPSRFIQPLTFAVGPSFSCSVPQNTYADTGLRASKCP